MTMHLKRLENHAMSDRKESDYNYSVPFGTGLFNENGILRPDAYLRKATDLADQHVKAFNANNAKLMEEFGVAWVLLAMVVHLLAPVRQNDVLTANTWCTGWRHGMYGRDMIFRNEAGEDVFGVGSMWTLLDVKKREIYRGEEAPAAMDLREEPPLYPGKKARFKTKKYDLEEAGIRQVYPSMIDASAHVNNSRYGEFLYDTMSEEARARLAEVDRLEFYFHGELSAGDTFLLQRFENTEEVLVTGTKADQEAFVARVVFK